MPTNTPTSCYDMDYAASSWTSYRIPPRTLSNQWSTDAQMSSSSENNASSDNYPRTPSNRWSVDAQQTSDSVYEGISNILSRSSYHPAHDPLYRHPVLDLRRIGDAEPGANSENSLESSSNTDSIASRWSSYRTPRDPSKWPSNWSLVNTRPKGHLQITVKPAQPKCTACWTELDESTTPMPCGHYWCSLCIVRRFTKIRNQTEWPVRCHNTKCVISLDTARPFLKDEDLQRLIPFIEEFETAVMDRVYCSNTRCSTFIPRRDTEDRIAHCEACQTDTCSDCKGAAHESDDCPLPDQDEQKLLIKSHKEKWQRCTRCGQMCERISGCLRIECLCGYNFCYHCAGPIYSCNGCPELEYGSRSRDRQARRQREQAERAPKQLHDYKQDFAAFTIRRARARTEGGLTPASGTPYQQRQRLEDEE